MTRPDDRFSSEADALDRYLDRLSAGDVSPPADLNPRTAAAVQRLDALARATTENLVAPSTQQRRWETLMEQRTSFSPATQEPHGAIAHAGSFTLPSSRSSPPGRSRATGTTRDSRQRPDASRALGVIATLTLMMLVGLAGVGLYLTAPRGGDEPTHLAGGLATPAVSVAPSHAGTVVVDVSADRRMIAPLPCVAPMADYDQLMLELWAHANDPNAMPVGDSPYVTATPHPTLDGVRVFDLLPGRTPSPKEIDALLTLVGSYLSCGPLQAATLSTDSFLQRQVFAPDRNASRLLLSWWSEANDPAAYPSPVIVDPRGLSAYGFRTTEDGQVVAYLDLPGPTGITNASGSQVLEPTYDRRAYVVIEQAGDGEWRIADLVYPGWSLDEICPAACATPAV